MEEQGYTEESYEEWKENDMRAELFAESLEELMEKKVLLDVLHEALESLMPEEKELAVKVLGEEMRVSDFAKMKKEHRTTVSSRKQRVLEKIRAFLSRKDFLWGDSTVYRNGCFFDRDFKECRKVFKK